MLKFIIRSALSSKYAEQYEFKKFDEMFADLLKTAQPNINGDTQYSKENDVDNYTKRQYNNSQLSRANKQGELVNDYYNALDKSEWREYYNSIAQSGYLENTNIGDIIIQAINDKIVISERQVTGKDAHDFQVIDAYQLFDELNYETKNIVDFIKKKGKGYDEKQIINAILGYARIVDGEKSFRRYDKYNMRYGGSFSRRGHSSRNNDKGIDKDFKETVDGKRDKSSSQRNIQKISTSINETKAGVNTSAFSNADTTQHSQSGDTYQYW